MLERLPKALGRALRNVHTDTRRLLINDDAFVAVPMDIEVRSPVFDAGDPIPALYTADGDKVSPPLTWMGVPPEADSVALVIEDADSPTPEPVVHALAWNFEGRDAVLVEGELPNGPDSPGWTPMGLNSLLRPQYLPPDPPPGHGEHRYAFEVFALDSKLDLEQGAGRRELLSALRRHVIAKGCLVGKYGRPAAP